MATKTRTCGEKFSLLEGGNKTGDSAPGGKMKAWKGKGTPRGGEEEEMRTSISTENLVIRN